MCVCLPDIMELVVANALSFRPGTIVDRPAAVCMLYMRERSLRHVQLLIQK